MVGASCLAHLGLLGLVLASPGEGPVALPQVIDVELLGAPAAPPPAPPAPAPAAAAEPPPRVEPVAPPPPPPPVPEAVVLPEKPRELPKPKPKPEPKREVFRVPEKKQEKSLEELMAEMRGEPVEPSREQVLAQMRQQAGESAPSPAPQAQAPAGNVLSADEVEWHRQVRRHMKAHWRLAAGFRKQVLETVVSVKLDGAGNILGDPKLVRRSGNLWYDDSVERALAAASPLPAPPKAGTQQLVFRPEDSF